MPQQVTVLLTVVMVPPHVHITGIKRFARSRSKSARICSSSAVSGSGRASMLTSKVAEEPIKTTPAHVSSLVDWQTSSIVLGSPSSQSAPIGTAAQRIVSWGLSPRSSQLLSACDTPN